MPMASLTHVLRHLRTLSEAQASRDLSDGELLERFRVHREETAFALLVQRHGPLEELFLTLTGGGRPPTNGRSATVEKEIVPQGDLTA